MGTTEDADEREYTYSGNDPDNGGINDLGDSSFGAGQVRWFRVFAITNENDGDDNTGGTKVDIGDGDTNNAGIENNDPPSPEETSPTAEDMGKAKPEYGMTGDPAGAPTQDEAMAPPAPVDLTAEVASDTNLIERNERGVLLLWNEPEDGEGITSYVVERRIDGGDADGEGTAIGVIAWSAATPTDERTSYRDSREPVDGEMLEYRVGSRGATTVDGTNWSGWIEFPTTHIAHTGPLGDASGLTAIKNSDGTMVTLNWTAGTNANIHWVAGVRKNADGTYNTADVANTVWTKADMHSSHTVDVSGLAAGTYVLTVIAGQSNEATGVENWNSDWVTPFAEVVLP